MKKLILHIIVVLVISGCSVGMAMSGKKTPNLGMVQVGASRGEIELTLGPPAKTATLPNGNRMDVYEYELGNDPSPGRAVSHFVMDLLTLGAWEIVGTPIEAIQGDKKILNVIYNKDDEVIGINSPMMKKKGKK